MSYSDAGLITIRGETGDALSKRGKDAESLVQRTGNVCRLLSTVPHLGKAAVACFAVSGGIAYALGYK